MHVSSRPAAHEAVSLPPQAVLALRPPAGSRYDMWKAIVEAALSFPGTVPQNDPVSALLRTLTTLSGRIGGGALPLKRVIHCWAIAQRRSWTFEVF